MCTFTRRCTLDTPSPAASGTHCRSWERCGAPSCSARPLSGRYPAQWERSGKKHSSGRRSQPPAAHSLAQPGKRSPWLLPRPETSQGERGRCGAFLAAYSMPAEEAWLQGHWSREGRPTCMSTACLAALLAEGGMHGTRRGLHTKLFTSRPGRPTHASCVRTQSANASTAATHTEAGHVTSRCLPSVNGWA